MKILLVNDDGIEAPGIKALIDTLSREHELFVIAPNGQRSGFSQSINYMRSICVEKRELQGHESIAAYAVDGTPADCVKIAQLSLCPDADLVISGINEGENMGRDICYSGTFGAALEAAVYGKRAIALSCDVEAGPPNYEFAAEFILDFVKNFDMARVPFGTVININIPLIVDGKAKGVMITRQAGLHYQEQYLITQDDGKTMYQLYGDDIEEAEEGTDIWAVMNGYISISPLKYNRTDEDGLIILEGLQK